MRISPNTNNTIKWQIVLYNIKINHTCYIDFIWKILTFGSSKHDYYIIIKNFCRILNGQGKKENKLGMGLKFCTQEKRVEEMEWELY